jgi:solute carrier family 25 folate transporter 32
VRERCPVHSFKRIVVSNNSIQNHHHHHHHHHHHVVVVIIIFAGKKTVNDLTLIELILASSGSKIIASMAAYPHEVIRARLQYHHLDKMTNFNHLNYMRYRTMTSTIVTTYREEGLRGFYRGMATNLLRVTPACAITFTTYELISKTLIRWGL